MILQSIPARTTHNVADKEDSHRNGNSCHKKEKQDARILYDQPDWESLTATRTRCESNLTSLSGH